jgi:flavin reductase (DIM6/NTAB) family NADH-FMN oxidoreductase RutF
MTALPETRIVGPGAFWRAIGMRSAGVAIVTTASPDGPVGLLALSVTHLCADPPTIMLSLDKATAAGRDLLANGTFCVNFLARPQKFIADRFADRNGPKGADRLRDVPMTTLATGAPAIAGALGTFDCALDEAIERHGTLIVLARLIDAVRDEAADPLIAFAGRIG